jgi:TetR/AcrR family transcriptional regulator, transcriptional repressor for nem operon
VGGSQRFDRGEGALVPVTILVALGDAAEREARARGGPRLAPVLARQQATRERVVGDHYYFKTKDALGEALVDTLASAQVSLREAWDAKSDPRARLAAFVQTIVSNRDSLARSGCPIGTLCAELHKLHDDERSPLARHAATLFRDLLDWLEAQFRLLGKQGESRALAVHLLSALEGASLLAHTFDDAQLVAREGARLERWVRAL